jgi:hypothetical protein
MTPRTPNLSKAVRASALALVVGLAGCALGNDSNPPALSVDLYWLVRGGNRHGDERCSDSGVETMTFTLTDTNSGQVVVQNEDSDDGRQCENGFDFVDVGPGDYRLDVKGFDADNNQLWSGSCDVSLGRFDRLFKCDVGMRSSSSSSSDAGTGNTNDQDAGT